MSAVNVAIEGRIDRRAIARGVSTGKHVLLADSRPENAKAAADVMSNAGFTVSTALVDIASPDSIHELVGAATKLGDVAGLTGASPSQASPATILKVDLYGTAVLLEEFGNVIARGGSGIVLRDHYVGCDEDVTWTRLKGAEWRALAPRQETILDWLAAKHRSAAATAAASGATP